MFDFILGLFLAGLLVRGWLRGFVRELLDLVGLIVGLWVAIRLSGPLGDFLSAGFGVSPEVARIGAGIALFLLFGVSMSVAAHFLSRLMSLPGLNLINRLGGAAMAVAWGVALVVVFVNVARVIPFLDSWEEQLDDSTVVNAIAGPDALPQELFESLAGDNVLAALAAIQDIFGASRAVPEGPETLEFPPALPDEIRQVRGETDAVIDEINEFRAGLEARAVVPSDAMAEAAEGRAETIYTTGRLARSTDCVAVLEASGAQVARCGEALALAGSALGALDGIFESETGRAELSESAYDRIGVSVVDGPTGRLLMIFLGR
jgi:membrane protein required for colicin V production